MYEKYGCCVYIRLLPWPFVDSRHVFGFRNVRKVFLSCANMYYYMFWPRWYAGDDFDFKICGFEQQIHKQIHKHTAFFVVHIQYFERRIRIRIISR
jgi:hypothetical protein